MYEKPMNSSGERQLPPIHRPQDSFHVSSFRPPAVPRTRASSRTRAAARCRASRFTGTPSPKSSGVETAPVEVQKADVQLSPKRVVQDIRQEQIDAILNGEDGWATATPDDRDETAAKRATPVRQNRGGAGGGDSFENFQQPFHEQPFHASGFEKIPRAISPVVGQENRQENRQEPPPQSKSMAKHPTQERMTGDSDFAFHTLAEDAGLSQAQLAPRKSPTSKATAMAEAVRPQPKNPVPTMTEAARSQPRDTVTRSAPPPPPPPPPPRHQDYTGCALIESGVQYYSEGDFGKALKAFSTALKTQRLNNRKDDIHVALTLSNLGSVYLQQNDLVEAENVLLESLDIKKRLAPQMVVADTLNNLGNCMNLRGELEASLIYYEDALDDSRTKKGKPYDEINALFNIGRLEIQRQHWTKAMMALNEACGMAKEVYGTNHPFVAQTLDLMGFAQLSTSKLDAAMVSFTGALAIYRRLHGPMHFEVANSLFNVGMVREAKGELNDSWEAYTTARDLYSRIGTPADHPGFAAVIRSIASVEKAIQARELRAAAKKSRKGNKKKAPLNVGQPARVAIPGVEV
jgi:Tfp pilus assembly protein PilF